MGLLKFCVVSILTTAVFWEITIQSAIPQEPQASEQVQSNNTNSTNSTSRAAPVSGSNFAEYNDACSDSGRMCNHLNDLVCDKSICICKQNVAEPDAPLVYARSARKCLKIATARNTWACSDDSQCTNTKYGKFSQCNTTTGGQSRCECIDTEGRGREVLLVDDVCYLKKDFNHDCSNDMECNATIPGEAVCLGSEGNKKGLCKCAAQHQYEPDYKECLKLGTIDSPCKTHTQCQHEEALGPLSVCDETKKTCKCWDNKESGKWDTKFHDGRCRYSRGLNETCNTKQECELGYHKNADCIEHPSYNGEKVCQCPPGAECKSSGPFTCSASMAVTIVGLCSCAYYSVNQS